MAHANGLKTQIITFGSGVLLTMIIGWFGWGQRVLTPETAPWPDDKPGVVADITRNADGLVQVREDVRRIERWMSRTDSTLGIMMDRQQRILRAVENGRD